MSKEEMDTLSRILRVNQAGELAANWIYKGQIFVLGSDKKLNDTLTHMLEQEKVHLNTFNEIISTNCTRPSLLSPVWASAGFILGATTALLSKEAAMLCTEAVETTIGIHYNNQLRTLLSINNPNAKSLAKIISKFRDEELEHLDIALKENSQEAPARSFLRGVISTGCKAAIWVAERV